MSVYRTPPKSPQDLLDFLAGCVEHHMEYENQDVHQAGVPDDELVSADSDFVRPRGMIVGPFRDGEKLYSFVIPRNSIVRID